MKKHPSPASGKLFVHNDGAGLPGRADLKVRAEEIALIEGHAEPTVTDYEQARRELDGSALPPTSEVENRRERTVPRDPSEPPGVEGEEKPSEEAPDEQLAAERLVLEGVEEAQHEQMLADRRRKST